MIDWTSVDEYACSNLDVTKYGSLVVIPNKLMQLLALRAAWESIKVHKSDWMSDIQEFSGIPTVRLLEINEYDFVSRYPKVLTTWEDDTEVTSHPYPPYDPNHDFFD